VNATDLLDAADRIWRDRPALREHARRAWYRGFASGSAWMEEVRGATSAGRAGQDNLLGILKNGGAALAAAAAAAGMYGVTRRAGGPSVAAALASVTFVLGFYAIEGQMVFLFPIATEARAAGHDPSVANILRECRARTVRAGGTWQVMRVVMPISARMIFGGFQGHGFLRSWCLGCIAVVLWNEEVRA
jgi:hypothetical protein